MPSQGGKPSPICPRAGHLGVENDLWAQTDTMMDSVVCVCGHSTEKEKNQEKQGIKINSGVIYFWKPRVTPPPHDTKNKRGDGDQDREGGGWKTGRKSAHFPPAGSHFPGAKNKYESARVSFFLTEIENSEAGAHLTTAINVCFRTCHEDMGARSAGVLDHSSAWPWWHGKLTWGGTVHQLKK